MNILETLLIYYFIRQSNYTDISGTTVPIFRVAMNDRNSKINTLHNISITFTENCCQTWF